MSKIDLLLTVNQAATDTGGLEAAGEPIPIMVHYTGDLAPLQAAGFRPRSVFGDVASGEIAPGQLQALSAVPSVVYIEGPYALSLDLDVAVPEARATTVHNAPGVGTPPTTYRGRNVIVGIIDSGIDYTHPAFRNADGTTRILSIWDQGPVPVPPPPVGAAPAGFGYGREYDMTAINTALGNANPLSVVPHQDGSAVGHGTHVAGIAAGNGRPAGTFVGLAPEANLIVVAPVEVGDIADSVRTSEAIHYIFTRAATLNRPCVINMSRSSNIGPHDGTSLLERAIDQELGTPGRAYVQSSGNQAAFLIHTNGTVPANGAFTARFNVPTPADPTAAIDIWYARAGRLTVTVTDPAGNVTAALAAPAANASAVGGGVLPSGNQVTIGSDVDRNDLNRDNRIIIRIDRNTAAAISNGNWTITLTNTTGQAARFDAWIERGNRNRIPTWVTPVGLAQSTVATPATSREAIVVGSYITKTGAGAAAGAAGGGIAATSSRGPTRDGRVKPDISAPGEFVMSARATTVTAATTTDASGQYHLLAGTSVSTPVVTGAIALILQKNPTLLAEQIRAGLGATARSDANVTGAGAAPNNTFGRGKLDVAAAVAHNYAAATNRNWVRIRSELYNWTMSPLPPTFEITSNENGQAVIELAWDPQAMLAPSTGYVPLRYYSSDRRLTVNINRAAGGTMAIDIPEQSIRLTNNRFQWTMPQALWDGYREEMNKAMMTPPQSTMSRNIYYRVRFTATGATSPLIWPPDSSFQNNPLAQRLAIIALNRAPITQVAPDQPAIDAMDPPYKSLLLWLWQHLPADHADRVSLNRLFSHRFFTNEIETPIRAKILTLWLFAGPTSRNRLYQLLDMRFKNASNVEMTILKQADLRDRVLLVDHLLQMRVLVPHPDLPGVTVREQLVDDVITELMDPNGQVNQGQASTCAPTGLQTLLINTNAAEYARLMKGLLSSTGQVMLANGDTLAIPPGIYQAARYAGAQGSAFFVRTNSELAFQSSILKYAKGAAFPSYDPAVPNSVNTVFQATLSQGLTSAEMERALRGLFGRAFTTTVAPAPTPELRNAFVQAMSGSREPLMMVVHWNAPAGAANTGLHAVVALRSEGGRVFFKNPQYAGSRPPTGAAPNSSVANPPRRYDDPTQALESMGDADLAQWIRWFHRPA